MKHDGREILNQLLTKAYAGVKDFPISQDVKKHIQGDKRFCWAPGWGELIENQVKFINNAYLAGVRAKNLGSGPETDRTIREALYIGNDAKGNTPPVLERLIITAYKAGKGAINGENS